MNSGNLMVLFAAGSIVAVPVAAVLLWLFRRAVIRGMKSATGAIADRMPRAPAIQPRTQDGSTFSEARRTLRRAFGIYLAAGLAFVVTLTILQFFSYRMVPNYVNFTYSALLYTPPLLFVLFAVVPRGRSRLAALAAYLGITTLVLSWVGIRNPDIVGEIVWLTSLSAAVSLLLIAFSMRRLRAAGPLVLGMVVAGVAGAGVALQSALPYRVLGYVTGLLSLPSEPMRYAAVIGLPLLGCVVAGSLLLGGVGSAYRHKLLSDQAIFLDAVFLWFGVAYGIQMASEGPIWLLTGPAAFLVYVLVGRVGFALSRAISQPHRKELLLLRPFSLGRRSEQLFADLSKVWLWTGPIHMIAGPDLVVSTVAPVEFLAFLSWRMRSRFVGDSARLNDRLGRLDRTPDPDGRYRVNQLFCSDTVWREAMCELAARSDVILMDLRGLTPANQGCLYELGVILAAVPLERVFFAVDDTTDWDYLNWAVAGMWGQLPPESHNRVFGGIASRLLHLDGGARTHEGLVRSLLEPAGAKPPTVPAPAVS